MDDDPSTAAMEARLLHVERGLAAIDGGLRALRVEVVAAAQGIWDSWPDARAAVPTTPTPTPTPVTANFSGTILGCNALPLDGASVAVNPTGTGPATWSGTTDSSGAFAGSVEVPTSGTTVGLTASAPDPARMAELTTSVSLDGGANDLGTYTLTPAGGHACVAGCAMPLKKTLQVADSVYGTFALTWVSTISGWGSGTQTLAFGGGGGCAASSTQAVYGFGFDATGPATVGYRSTAPPCPTASGSFVGLNGTLVSSACPPSVSYVYNITGGLYVGTQTLTITEL